MEPTVFTVTALNEYIKARLDEDAFLQRVCVRGEISNFVNHERTGHFYFTLKDETAVLHAVMFKGNNARLAFLPENGMKVVAIGRISAYVRSGQYQIYCEGMEPDGVGALYLAYEKLRQKLSAEGLFDEAHKKPLPKVPLRVGVITSPTGAAVRDIIHVCGRRFPLAQIILYPALVQGENAPAQLCEALRFFNARLPVDVIIMGRGGGSLEDLWAFNDEKLAREVYASEIPVVSAVGHETDFTICDFVADVRAPTPSAAAEIALPDKEETQRRLGNVQTHLRTVLQGRLAREKQRLQSLADKPCLKRPEGFLEERRITLDRADTALKQSAGLFFERRKSAFSALAAKLDALSPLSAFSRGYSAVLGADGRAVKSVRQLHVGDALTLITSDGRAKSQVTEITEE